MSIYHLEIVTAGYTNGVSRCIRTLTDSFAVDRRVRVTWVRFSYHIVLKPYREVHEGYQIIHIPLSERLNEIWGNSDEKLAFYRSVLPLLRQDADRYPCSIIHIHTMNLIGLGQYLRDHIRCVIVSTVHCIPWKNFYNNNLVTFNQLYESYYVDKDYSQPSRFLCGEYEQQTYEASDGLACVTECARIFVNRVSTRHSGKLTVIPNGLRDTHLSLTRNPRQISLLFVGGAGPSKGLDFLLQALCSVKLKHDFILHIAGCYGEAQIRSIRKKYPFLDIIFHGTLSWNLLIRIYETCTIGIIPSLLEQCSCVAIEMMMTGMPVIASDVDGLGEMFSHAYNALAIPSIYSKRNGLRLDTEILSKSICSLIENPELRHTLSINARQTYCKTYRDVNMKQSYMRLYESFYN